jgi:hypothetical protein
MATYTDVLRTQQLNAYFPDVLPHIAHLEGRVAELRGRCVNAETLLAAVTQRAVTAETDAARLRLYVAELEALLPADARERAAERAAAKLEEMGEE